MSAERSLGRFINRQTRFCAGPDVLVTSAAQRGRQPLPFFLPPLVFGLDPFLDRGLFGVEGLRPLFVLPLRRVQRRLRFRDQLRALGSLLLPLRLFLTTLGVPPLLLALELGGGLACIFVANLAVACLFGSGRWLLFRPPASSFRSGRSACSAKRPFDPAGRLSTTPGFDMVAATTSGSSVSLAAPWWKRLLPAPHASSAAFIDGAAIARS